MCRADIATDEEAARARAARAAAGAAAEGSGRSDEASGDGGGGAGDGGDGGSVINGLGDVPATPADKTHKVLTREAAADAALSALQLQRLRTTLAESECELRLAEEPAP